MNMKANPTINNFIQNIIFVDILEDQKLAAFIRDAEQEITYSKQEALRFLEID